MMFGSSHTPGSSQSPPGVSQSSPSSAIVMTTGYAMIDLRRRISLRKYCTSTAARPSMSHSPPSSQVPNESHVPSLVQPATAAPASSIRMKMRDHHEYQSQSIS